jgi:hypothetical protein
VEVVGDVLGAGASDKMVAAYAITTNRVLVTQDQDDFRGHYRDSPSHPGTDCDLSGPAQLDSPKLVAALENVARAYSNTILRAMGIFRQPSSITRRASQAGNTAFSVLSKNPTRWVIL